MQHNRTSLAENSDRQRFVTLPKVQRQDQVYHVEGQQVSENLAHARALYGHELQSNPGGEEPGGFNPRKVKRQTTEQHWHAT